MAIVSWNTRGLNGVESVRQAKLLIKNHKPEFLFLMETKLADGKVNKMCNILGFDRGFEIPRIGLGGGLMALWKDTVDVTYLTSSTNHFSCFLRWDNQPRSWHFCGFYGEPTTSNRCYTWDLLQKLRTVYSGPWLVMGDFNEILSQDDKEGGGLRNESQIEAFRITLEVCDLKPLEYRGNHFTWYKNTDNGGIKERLDWAMANEAWMEVFPNNSLTHLDFFHSDHRGLFLCFQDHLDIPNKRKRPRFRFENMWAGEVECKEIVTSNWRSENQSALFGVISNIKQCSENLAHWNQSKFGSIAKDIRETHQKITLFHNLKGQLDNDGELKFMKQKLNELLLKEEIFWKQRSRILWLKEGDQNTKFFHQRAKKRNKINTIKGLLNEEEVWCTNEEEISSTIKRFYENLFTSSIPELEKIDKLLSAVKPLVTEGMVRSLERGFTIEEVKNAVFSISADKSPGPDGMNGKFYQQYWDIVGPLFSKAILDCLNEQADMESINSTLVTLIPKVKEPRSVGDFRPISLCNVSYKVISKVLINRLKPILPRIINESQSAFVPGRLITDNALIAYESLHHLRTMKDGKRCYAAMKLDMSKAYDRVEWIYIEKMLLKIGFPQQWVKKLMKCVTSVRYSFQINGEVYGEVIPSRGLRQGDPLSPYLFLICAEGFSALLRQAENRRDIMGIKVARNAPAISHLFFADDSLIFLKASERSLQTIQDVFKLYSECSGQMVNFNKSLLCFSPNTKEDTRVMFANCLKMQTTEAIETYLGLPMLGGKNKKVLFRSIKDKIWVTLNLWRNDLFSQAGKEILLKAVVQAMPTYLMSCFRIPDGQCQEIERLLARFWWGSVHSKHKIHWRAWKKISIPREEGGLGFRNFVRYNQALLAKQAWRILTFPTSPLSQVLRAKYFSNSSFLESKEGSCPSLTWRSICWGKSLLITGLRRRIGNGQSTKAFKDPWLPRPPSFLPITQGLNQNMSVSEFIQQPGIWNRDLIEQYFLTPDSQLILSIPLSPFNHSDSWFWHYTKNGNYTVKSGYNLAMKVDKTEPSTSSDGISLWWKAFWAIKVPRKILMFAWRGYHEILPTIKGLYRRNVSSHSNCPLCGYGEDSNAHAVFWCPISQEVWTLMDYPFLVGNKEDISFRGTLIYASEILEREDFAKMLIIAWGIWLERNKRTHGIQQRDPHQIKSWIALYYDEIKNAHDNGLIINKNSTSVGHMEIENHELALFVDAAISTPSQKIGLGAVIVTPTKKIQAAISKPLQGTLSVLHAEALAMLVGIHWTRTIGLDVQKIFSDSLTIVQALNNNTEFNNELGIFLNDIKGLLGEYSGMSINHVRRNYNVAAHKMAKHALQLEEEAIWIEDISHISGNHD